MRSSGTSSSSPSALMRRADFGAKPSKALIAAPVRCARNSSTLTQQDQGHDRGGGFEVNSHFARGPRETRRETGARNRTGHYCRRQATPHQGNQG